MESSTASNRWDAIVIGSGMGGLTAAAYLAVAGRRTLVLEAYDVVGGCSHVFRRKNQWEFEVGVHYLGDCGPTGQIPTMLRGLGLEGKIDFRPLDPDGFDTIVYPDVTVKVPVGWDRYLENLIVEYPGDEKGLRRFVGVLAQIGGSLDRSTSPASAGGQLRLAVGARTAALWALRPLSALLDACNLSPRARSVVSTQWGSYACPPSQAPVILHAGFLQNYIGLGAYYPAGGGQVFAAHLTDVIHAHGSMVRTRARVDRILVENQRVVGVELQDGEQFRAPVVVSNADLKRTYLEMIDPEHLSARTRRRVAGYRMSPPFVNLYLGLDIDLTEQIPATNFFSVPTADDPDRLYNDLVAVGAGRDREAWMAQVPSRLGAFVHSSTVKDPGYAPYAPQGHSAVEAMTFVCPDAELWGSGDVTAAGRAYRHDPGYQELKDFVTDVLIQRVNDVIPGAADHVVYREAATPLTQQRYTRSSGGAAYGIACDAKQFGLFRPKNRTAIEGLFVAGASCVWGPAIEGSMLSGLHAAKAAIGRDLVAEIRAGRVIGDPTRLTAGGPGWDALAASKGLSWKEAPSTSEVAA